MKSKLSLLTTLGLGLISCQKDPHAGTETPSAQWQRPTLSITSQSESELRSSPGRIVSSQQVQVASRMMGFITRMMVEEGQMVKKGQVLFSIDAIDIDGQEKLASAGGAQARALLADAKADFERFDRLYRDSAATKSQWEKMKLNLEIAIQRVHQADAGLGTVKAQRKYLDVLAPIDGVISQKMASSGNLALPGHPLLILENPQTLEVQTQVPSEIFQNLKVGELACLNLDGQKDCQSKITHLVPTADPMSHTHLVKLSVGNGNYHAGSYVDVGFKTGEKSSIEIPGEALSLRAGISGVLIVDAKNQAHFRMVRAVENGNKYRIQAGLQAGDKIVLGATDSIKEGDRIQELNHE